MKDARSVLRLLATATHSVSMNGDDGANSRGTAAGSYHRPPLARRENHRVVYAGVAPPGWDLIIPRQATTSIEPLLNPPVAVPDPYGWLRDESRCQPDVVRYLQEENDYTAFQTHHLQNLRECIYQELIQSLQETDYSIPRSWGHSYVYYTRTYQGKSYSTMCRAPMEHYVTSKDNNDNNEKNQRIAGMITWDGLPSSPILPDEQIVLDVNALADGQDYCGMGAIEPSPSERLVAYMVDFIGDEVYELHIENIDTGETLYHSPDDWELGDEVLWGNDDSTLFYLVVDDEQRPYQLYRKKVFEEQDTDELLYEENDVLFWLSIYKSLDGKYLFVDSASAETSEVWFLDLQDPVGKLQCVANRRPKVLYEVQHRHNHWWIASNVGGTPNLQLLTSPAQPNCQEEWTPVIDPDSNQPLFDGSYEKALEDITTFSRHVVLEGRQDGIPRIWILSMDAQGCNPARVERLEFPEAAHDVGLGEHYQFDVDKILVGYQSLVTPAQGIEICLEDSSIRSILKERAVPGYNKELYGCDRVTVTSRDGNTEIPVSLVYLKSVMERAQTEPVHVHLYAYGAYGCSEEDEFCSTILPLLNRGIIYVVAHVRGGGEMGRQWYEEPNGGKYLCKKNTFNDFLDVARWLIYQKRWTTPDMLSCEGRSAGGLTVGAAINQAPELFKMAILGVPFVDVICTMVDASINLVATEWEEWGNPNEIKYFQYMMEYSPMNNVQKNAKYPACLILAGLHDPRVQYWEPAKFAATLRYYQGTDSGPVCLKTELSAGHFSASDRYKHLRETAFDYAFLLDQVGLANGA